MRLLKETGLGERRCAHCLEPFSPEDGRVGNNITSRLCSSCKELLQPYAGAKCSLCGNPLATCASRICSACLAEKPGWQGCAYFGLYEGVLRDLILRFKFDHELHIAHLLADFLYSISGCLPAPDFIMGMPQYPAHLRKRGFNQAHELAKLLAKSRGFSVNCVMLQRRKASRPQEGLSAWERKENVKGTFAASRDAKDKIIWLVDDVMTSGATYREATASLRKAGAKAVYCLFVARTPEEF